MEADVDLSKFKTSDWLKVGGAIGFFIFGFFHWLKSDFGGSVGTQRLRLLLDGTRAVAARHRNGCHHVPLATGSDEAPARCRGRSSSCVPRGSRRCCC